MDPTAAAQWALLADPSARERLGQYPSIPKSAPPQELLPALLANPATRDAVVRYVRLDRALASELAADPDSMVRSAVAAHPDLPPDIRDTLAADRNKDVQVTVFIRPDTPEPIRARIHADITGGIDLMAELAAGRYEAVFGDDGDLLLAQLTLTSPELDWVTANPLPHVGSPYPSFRACAAAGAGLPADAVARLLDDPVSMVRVAMLRNTTEPVDPAIVERIDREYEPEKRYGLNWRPADEVVFPPETLRRFATDPDARMRLLAVRDPDLPADLAAQLAADPDVDVRRAIAVHPNLPSVIRSRTGPVER